MLHTVKPVPVGYAVDVELVDEAVEEVEEVDVVWAPSTNSRFKATLPAPAKTVARVLSGGIASVEKTSEPP